MKSSMKSSSSVSFPEDSEEVVAIEAAKRPWAPPWEKIPFATWDLGTLLEKMRPRLAEEGVSSSGLARRLGLGLPASGRVSIPEFTETVRKLRALSDAELQMLAFNLAAGKSYIHWQQFVSSIQGRLNTFRVKVVQDQFETLGGGRPGEEGTVELDTMDVGLNPWGLLLVQKRLTSVDQIRRNLLESFGGHDGGPISYPAFEDYFKTQSLNFPDDATFQTQVTLVWQAPKTQKQGSRYPLRVPTGNGYWVKKPKPDTRVKC